MSIKAPSKSAILAAILLVALIGLYAVYERYTGTLRAGLGDKKTEILQTKQMLADANAGLIVAAETEKSLRAEIDALGARSKEEAQRLMDQLDAAKQASLDLRKDMDALRAQHEETLATEKQAASQAYAELEAQRDAANEKITALDTEIGQLKQAMADSARENEARMAAAIQGHQAQAQERERQLEERVAFFRTALEGSEPQRSAQLLGLEQQAASDRQALEAERQAKQILEAELGQRLADAAKAIDEKAAALVQAEATHASRMASAEERIAKLAEELKDERTERSALQQKHDDTVLEFRRNLAGSEQAKAALVDKMAKADERIATLAKDLKGERAALADLQQKHNAMVAELRRDLAAGEKSLTVAQAELAAAAQAEQAHGKQSAEAQARIASLEETLDRERQEAERRRLALHDEHREAVARIQGLYTQFAELAGRKTDRGMLLSLAEEDLRFRPDLAILPKAQIPSLERIAALLVAYPNLTARIEGHTDSVGKDAGNLRLSQQRADAVKQALVDRGVASERLTAEGMGESRPVADNATAAGRSRNRRVEIYVIDQAAEASQ